MGASSSVPIYYRALAGFIALVAFKSAVNRVLLVRKAFAAIRYLISVLVPKAKAELCAEIVQAALYYGSTHSAPCLLPWVPHSLDLAWMDTGGRNSRVCSSLLSTCH